MYDRLRPLLILADYDTGAHSNVQDLDRGTRTCMTELAFGFYTNPGSMSLEKYQIRIITIAEDSNRSASHPLQVWLSAIALRGNGESQ